MVAKKGGVSSNASNQSAAQQAADAAIKAIPSNQLGLDVNIKKSSEASKHQEQQETNSVAPSEQQQSQNAQQQKAIPGEQKTEQTRPAQSAAQASTARFESVRDLTGKDIDVPQQNSGYTFKAPVEDNAQSQEFSIDSISRSLDTNGNEIDQNPNEYDSYQTPPLTRNAPKVETPPAVTQESLASAQKLVDKHEPQEQPGPTRPVGNTNSNVLDAGIEPLSKTDLVYTTMSTERDRNTQRREKENVESTVASKSWTGNGFAEKAISGDILRPVRPDAASIGTEIVQQIVREPGNNLIQIVNETIGENFTVEQVLTERGIRSFMKAVNNADIYIVATKSPVPEPASTQGRLLKIHEGRGILIHPTQTKAWNLDFDGDDVKIQFAYDKNLFRNCMDYMIGLDGNVMLDTDFFPIVDTGNMDLKSFKTLVKESFLASVSPEVSTDGIAEAFYKITRPDLYGKEDYWKDLILEINKVASRYSDRTKMISNLISDLYDANLLCKRIEANAIFENDGNIFFETQTIADQYLQIIISDIYAGVLPPNYHDFILGMHKFTGEISGKNVQFRIGADFAKKIKWHKDLTIGEGNMQELYELTLEAGMSELMNNRSYLGDKIRYAKRIMRERVISIVGFPDNPKYEGSISTFLKSFGTEYMKIKRIVDLASIKMTMDMDIEYSSVSQTEEIENSLTSFVTPFVEIYGDYTMDRMFMGIGGFKKEEMLPRYRKMTVRDFQRNNRLNPIRKDIKSGGFTKYKSFMSVSYKEANVNHLIMAIADKRTSLASKFNKSLEDMLSEHVKMFRHIEKDIKNKFIDWRQYTSDMISMLRLSGPDMFAYFGMDDDVQFMTSRYGKLLRKAAAKNDADLFGGIRESMVFQYRMRHVVNVNAEISELTETGMFPADLAQLSVLQNQLNSEFEILASSSILWRSIVSEMKNDNVSFTQLKSMAKGMSRISRAASKEGPSYRAKDGTLIDAAEFWRTDKSHNSIVEVLTDPDIPKSIKDRICSDIVRVSEQFPHIKYYEMPSQLEMGPHSAYTSLTPMAYVDQPSILSDVEASTNKIQKAFEVSYDEIKKDIKALRKMSEKGELDERLRYLAKNLQAYLDINIDMVVDAIDEQLDKSSKAAEKPSAENSVNVLYSALSLQRGGYTNALYRSDDRVLGQIAEDQLTRFDVIQALADPNFSLTVYGANGKWILSRKNICGSNSETALWDTLEKHPRLALMLRPHIASAAKDRSYEKTNAKLSEIFDEDKKPSAVKEMHGRIYSELINHPMFLSMCAMYSPVHGVSARSNRGIRRETIKSMRLLICFLAKKQVYDQATIDFDNILKQMGTTPESLQEIGSMDPQSAKEFYEDMRDSLQKYTALVGKILRTGDYSKYVESFNFGSHKFKFDKTSLSLARDVRQTMTSAQTDIATEIEGGMTQRNTGVALYFMSRKDRYSIIDAYSTQDQWSQCYGCMTSTGQILTEENAMDLLEMVGNEPLIVEMRERQSVLDPTLDNSGHQFSAVARFATIKRAKAAEEKNLQAKKSGNDGTDLIVKTERYDNNAEQNKSDVEQAYENAVPDFKMFAAKLKLAHILMANDAKEGYKELTLANYVDIASEMILEVNDETLGSSIFIRSVEELSYALRRNMPQDIVENGNPREIIRAAEEIAAAVGIEGNEETKSTYRAAQRNSLHAIIARIQPAVYGKFVPARKARSSSFDRSFETAWKASRKERIVFPWSNEEFEKPERKIKSKHLTDKLHKELSTRIGLNYKNNPTSYKMIGFISSSNPVMNISPGMSSVWFIDNSATPEQIESAMKNCYAYGMTLAFRDSSAIGDFYEIFGDDVIPAPFGDDIYMIPFYDMRMNGGSSLDIPMAPASFQYDPRALTYVVHSRNNLYGQGDASIIASGANGALLDRSHPNASDIESISLESMFFNTFENFGDDLNYDIEGGPIQLATHEEIERDIVNWLDDGPEIDVGVALSNQNIDRIYKKLGLQIQEYREAFVKADENGLLPEGKPDQIIGWLKCYVKGYKNPVYAPIIPSPTGSKLAFPQQFSVDVSGTGLDMDKWNFDLKWTLTKDLQGQYIKIFEGVGGANKQMAFLDKTIDLGKFLFGRTVDAVVAAASVASRRLGTAARMDTLKTLAYTAGTPPFGYNYGSHPQSFPDGPEVFDEVTGQTRPFKDVLKERRIPLYGDGLSWANVIDQITRFSSDPAIDAFLKQQVQLAMKTRTVNPSDLLATKYTSDGQDVYSFMYVDYDFMFSDEIGFQQSLMKFYNSMMPNLCPPNIESYDGTTYFKPSLNSGYEYGSLQLLTPFPKPGGGWSYSWEIVTASFCYFNDDFSAMHKVGLNGASRTLEQLNAIAISGQPLQGFDLKQFARNATSPAQRIRKPHDIELDYAKFLRKD